MSRRSENRSRSRSRDRHRDRRRYDYSPEEARSERSDRRRIEDDQRSSRHHEDPSYRRQRGRRDNDHLRHEETRIPDRAPQWGNPGVEEEVKEEVNPEEVVKANFGVTGALAKDKVTGNVYNGVVLKWSEPVDAATPDRRWRLYVFQKDELKDTLHIHRQSAYLIGREEKVLRRLLWLSIHFYFYLFIKCIHTYMMNQVADIKLNNPSCSKQHAVIQFRKTESVIRPATDIDPAVTKKSTKPYIMDLESTNKTYLNGTAIDSSRYIEMRVKDVLRFGESSKEYVLLCE